MKFRLLILVAFLNMLPYTIQCAFSAGASYSTEITNATLTGEFGVDSGLDANDNIEYYYFIKLDHPVTVRDNTYNITEDNVTKIQLAIPFKFSARPYRGKRINVKGTLFHSFTAHHHTKILMTVAKAEDLSLVGQH